MKAFNGYDEAKVNKGSEAFEQLPKGAYVCKILNVREQPNKKGGSRFDIMFDIAEGEYKDFYSKQYQERKKDNEDAKFPNDGIYRLTIPEDDSEDWLKNAFKTFTTALEDSNSGYHWDWDEKKWKGKLFGGLFHVKQTEYNGNIYDHTQLKWVRSAADVRENKYGKLPNDKLIDSEKSNPNAPNDDFVNVPDGSADEIPFE